MQNTSAEVRIDNIYRDQIRYDNLLLWLVDKNFKLNLLSQQRLEKRAKMIFSRPKTINLCRLGWVTVANCDKIVVQNGNQMTAVVVISSEPVMHFNNYNCTSLEVGPQLL